MPATLAVLAVEIHQLCDAFSSAETKINVAEYYPCVDVHIHGDVTVIHNTPAAAVAAAAASDDDDAGASMDDVVARGAGKDEWVWPGSRGGAVEITVADGATVVEIVVRGVRRGSEGATPIVLGCVVLQLNTLSTSFKTRRWYTLCPPSEEDLELPSYLTTDEGAATLHASRRGVIEMSLILRMGEGASSASDIESDGFMDRRDSSDASRRRLNPALHEPLPCRLVDYCVVIGPTIVEATAIDGDDVVTPSIVYRYPKNSHEDLPLPEKLDWFAFPSGYKTYPASSTSRALLPRLFTFVLTVEPNIRVYGICLVSFELTSLSKGGVQLEPSTRGSPKRRRRRSSLGRFLGRETKPLPTGRRIHCCWAPNCIIFLTRFPCISTLSACLQEFHLLRRRQGGSGLDDFRGTAKAWHRFEHYAQMLAEEVPLPVPGALVTSWGVEGHRFDISFPPVGATLPRSPFEVELLLECFPAREVIKIFTAVATEQRILFFSSNIALLAPLAIASGALLFPLQWEYTFIPILPKTLTEFLEAPMPFILGT
jgi:hypothetical protein